MQIDCGNLGSYGPDHMVQKVDGHEQQTWAEYLLDILLV